MPGWHSQESNTRTLTILAFSATAAAVAVLTTCWKLAQPSGDDRYGFVGAFKRLLGAAEPLLVQLVVIEAEIDNPLTIRRDRVPADSGCHKSFRS